MIDVKLRKLNNIIQANSDIELKVGDKLIIQTKKGKEYGKVISLNSKNSDGSEFTNNVIRKSLKIDDEKIKNLISDEEQIVKRVNKKIIQYNFNMKLVDACYTFDKKLLILIFTADNRIDFRNFAKELGKTFKTRIEFKQIGIRDKSKMLCGIGICGRKLCCSNNMDITSGVSINMAKNQGISLNPCKINGVCGRLKCCLKYENETYKNLKSNMPKLGSYVETIEGKGKVINLKPCCKSYSVLLENKNIIEIKVDDGSN